MIEFVDPLGYWGLFLIQVLGLASTLLVRIPRTGRVHDYLRGVYLGCLVVLGLATMAAVGADSVWWAWCGTTFSLMAVGGTVHLSGSPEPSGI
jgi:hypothetical protein